MPPLLGTLVFTFRCVVSALPVEVYRSQRDLGLCALSRVEL